MNVALAFVVGIGAFVVGRWMVGRTIDRETKRNITFLFAVLAVAVTLLSLLFVFAAYRAANH